MGRDNNTGDTRDLEEFKKQIQNWIDDRQEHGHQVSIDDINNHLMEVAQNENRRPRPNYNGFTDEQMTQMLCFPFEEGCPVQLNHLTDEEIEQIPIMRQVLHLMNALSEKELKLTPKGFLPVKMVTELYELGTHSEYSDHYEKKTEQRIPEIQLLHEVVTEMALVKVRFGKLSLTEKGKRLLKDHNDLMRAIILFLFTEFNTQWYRASDGYEIGNVGRLYSLWLLHHLGYECPDGQFYAHEYFKAFPSLWKDSDNKYFTTENLYLDRIICGLFYSIGLCEVYEIINKEESSRNYEVRKTPILEMMFSFEEPGEM